MYMCKPYADIFVYIDIYTICVYTHTTYICM